MTTAINCLRINAAMRLHETVLRYDLRRIISRNLLKIAMDKTFLERIVSIFISTAYDFFMILAILKIL